MRRPSAGALALALTTALALPGAGAAPPTGPGGATRAAALARASRVDGQLGSPRSLRWLAAPALLTRSAPQTPQARLFQELGSSWRAALDISTGVPARMFGAGLAAPGTSASPQVAEAFARAFLARHLEALAPGSTLADFQLVANDLDAGQRTVAFTQRHQGLPVMGGQLSLRFKNDRLFVIASEAVPVVPGAVRLPRSALPAATLRTAAVRSLAGAVADERVAPAATALLPVVGADGKTSLRPVRAVTVDVPASATQVVGRYQVFVDATSGEAVARRSLYQDATGTLKFRAPITHGAVGKPRIDYAAPFVSLTANGTAVETDANGVFTFAGANPAQLVVSAVGKLVKVTTVAQTGTPLAETLSLADGATAVIDRSDDRQADAQLSAYVFANEAKAWAKNVTQGELPWLDTQLLVFVNYDNSACNAFYSNDGPGSLNFFDEGTFLGMTCQNTAVVRNIVHHEFGHALHWHSVIPGTGIVDPAMGEGVGDYLAGTMSEDPTMGKGMFFDDIPLRNIDEADHERTWPDDVSYDVHITGLIYAGTMWDLRKALVAELGHDEGVALADRLVYQSLRRSTSIPTSYVEVLAADDDDGDLANGTPHGCLINAAFDAHGLAPQDAPGSAGVRRPVVDGDALSFDVHPSVCPNAAVTKVELQWDVRGVAGSGGTVELTGSPGAEGATTYATTLPAVPDGSVQRYRVVATLAGGRTISYPDNAADSLYERYVGPTTTLYCESFDGNAFPKGFTHKLLAGANGLGADEWMWGPPLSPESANEPKAAFSGMKVIGTDLGGSYREGWYAPGHTAILSTPAIDVQGAAVVRLQYRRWLNVEDGSYDQATISANGEPVWQNLATAAGTTSHRDHEWVFHDVDITSQIGAEGTVQIGFTIAADAEVEMGGWTIDDLCLVGVGTAAGPDAGVDEPGTGDDGCGCTVGRAPRPRGATAALGSFGLLAAALLLARRFRRA